LLTRLGDGRIWPAAPVPSADDAADVYLTYLHNKPDLEAFEADYLIDRGPGASVGLERYLCNHLHDWDARRQLLYRGVANGAVDGNGAVPVARRLAAEGEALADHSESRRYGTAALHQWARDFDRAERMFFDLADTTTDTALRAGSLYHLAELARDMGRTDDAMVFGRACLDVEPRHRAARALCNSLT
jgi:hypothetical protein